VSQRPNHIISLSILQPLELAVRLCVVSETYPCQPSAFEKPTANLSPNVTITCLRTALPSRYRSRIMMNRYIKVLRAPSWESRRCIGYIRYEHVPCRLRLLRSSIPKREALLGNPGRLMPSFHRFPMSLVTHVGGVMLSATEYYHIGE
jgi:hypothetical protein